MKFLRHPVERESLCDRAQINHAGSGVGNELDCGVVEMPARRGNFRAAFGGAHMESPLRGFLHLGGKRKAIKDLPGETPAPSRGKGRKSGHFAVIAEPAHEGFHAVGDRERRLRCLRGIRFLFAGNSHLPPGVHRVVRCHMDAAHRPAFPARS
ncbi:MAG: hypothetical protein WCQ16_00150 [Verrucomicrobiae bacterium]